MDETTAVIYGLDLTPLLENEKLNPGEYVLGFLDRFRQDVSTRLAKLG